MVATGAGASSRCGALGRDRTLRIHLKRNDGDTSSGHGGNSHASLAGDAVCGFGGVAAGASVPAPQQPLRISKAPTGVLQQSPG
ncbi:hypothetical protein ACCO45_012720 [Purpureocillium lilacinum]|uniref:Uncharacterized protein n=1 Tax=Purpureocillium lilacinum TaxID=33203 RepID=A0ACC4D8S4_PURLI